jgi:O-antigen chain-terminating methyltransferase
LSDNFYRAFEDKFRGSREDIIDRLKIYLPFVTPLIDIYEEASALDLGCGRGEWLEILSEVGVKARGVDLDKGMLEACTERGLNAELADALTSLRNLPDESQIVVSGFHIVEHVSFADWTEWINEAFRVLKPAGLIVLETPNPENLFVATRSFYLDPTHLNPIPPELLSFAVEFAGFSRVKILRLQEDKELANSSKISLTNIIKSASPDYSVIGQKPATMDLTEKFSSAFDIEYGLSLEMLLNKWDYQFEQLVVKANQVKIRQNWRHRVGNIKKQIWTR